MRLRCSDTQISYIGMVTLGFDFSKKSINAIEEVFLSHYGSCVAICNVVWNKLISSGQLIPCQRAEHLFWALLFMKVYNPQRVTCSMVKTTRPTFNKHVHHLIQLMSNFDTVSDCLCSLA